MIRGRSSASLVPADRDRLRKFRIQLEHKLGVTMGWPELRRALDAPFSWTTLQRALEGKPIRYSFYRFLVDFLDRYVPALHSPLDYKSRAAGEHEEEEETETAVAPVRRGSR